MKYFANFNANNGTSLMNDIESNNLHELIREVKARCRAEHLQNPGNKSSYAVWDEEGRQIAGGILWDTSKVFRNF